MSVSALGLTDWFFSGWTGTQMSDTHTVSISNIQSDITIAANYINTRMQPCRDAPPSNAHSTSMPNVMVTYTTAGGWSTPAACPWSCDLEFCTDGGGCAAGFLDRIAYTSGTASMWFGGDDRPDLVRSVGAGQGVTPTTTVTMNRFGFHLQGGFRFATTGQFGTQPNTAQLDRRDAGGNVIASYQTTRAPNFAGGWLYWDTPTTTLNAGTLYIFTAFLTNAFTQKVDSGTFGDTAATYAGGSGYAGQTGSGDLVSWNLWGTHPWDFQFRVQQRNPACD